MNSIAIVGAGRMARAYLEVFNSRNDVSVTGIYSRTKSRAHDLAGEFKINFVADSLEELYGNTGASGVVIAVSELATINICLEAIKFPWQMLVEKPIGLDLASTDFLLEKSRGNEARIYAAMNRRFYPSILGAKNAVDSHSGNRLVEIFDQEDPNSALGAGRELKVCDRWHFANSIHLIDLFNVFCRGELSEVKNVVRRKPGSSLDFTHSIIYFSDGDVGIYHSVWNAPGPWSVVINVAGKRYEMKPLESLITQSYPSRKSTIEPLQNNNEQMFKPGFYGQCDAFIDAINHRPSALLNLENYRNSALLTANLYDEK